MKDFMHTYYLLYYALCINQNAGGKILTASFISKAWLHTVKQGYLKTNLENIGNHCATLSYYPYNFCRSHAEFLFLVNYLHWENFQTPSVKYKFTLFLLICSICLLAVLYDTLCCSHKTDAAMKQIGMNLSLMLGILI